MRRLPARTGGGHAVFPRWSRDAFRIVTDLGRRDVLVLPTGIQHRRRFDLDRRILRYILFQRFHEGDHAQKTETDASGRHSTPPPDFPDFPDPFFDSVSCCFL